MTVSVECEVRTLDRGPVPRLVCGHTSHVGLGSPMPPARFCRPVVRINKKLNNGHTSMAVFCCLFANDVSGDAGRLRPDFSPRVLIPRSVQAAFPVANS
jgi:hypothetical protein